MSNHILEFDPDDTDGYETFSEYYEDNQREKQGKITDTTPDGHSGAVSVTMVGSSSKTEIMPNLTEAIKLAKLAAHPNSGGYKKITLSPSTGSPTYSSAYEWLTGGI